MRIQNAVFCISNTYLYFKLQIRRKSANCKIIVAVRRIYLCATGQRQTLTVGRSAHFSLH